MAVAFGIRRAATAEIEQAFDWYESQRLGLGLEYLTAIEATLARIRREPLVFPVVYRDVRRALVRRFPYALFFVATANRITILACTHLRRDPRRWQSRR